MIMKTVNKFILGLVALGALSGCKDKMTELNTNPNIIGITNPEYQFVGATMSFDRTGRESIASLYPGVMTMMQYIVKNDYSSPYANPTGLDFPSIGTPGQYWGMFYGQGGSLNSLINFIDLMAPESQTMYSDLRAISQGLMAYEAWRCFEVYGAAVYSQAFKGISEGNLTPTYDLGQAQYADIDAKLKASIDVLKADAPSNVFNLGKYDYFYGWSSESTSVVVADYKVQRANWAKFLSMIRLRMAWILKATDQAYFDKVVSETAAGDLMASLEEGCYYNYPKGDNGNANSDDQTEIQYSYGVTSNFVGFLKTHNDPRLPLLVRANGLSEAGPWNYPGTTGKGFQFIKENYPDMLYEGFGDLLKPTLAGAPMSEWNLYQGLQPNPDPVYAEHSVNADYQWLNGMNISIKILNPNSPNPLLSPTTGKPIVFAKDTTINLQVASSPQGRYFVPAGGKSFATGNSGNNGYDGPAVGDYEPAMRQNVMTYPQQCFMLAHLASTGAAVPGGGSAASWYEKAVRAAFAELQSDAQRYRIQIATNAAHPKLPAVNPNGLYVISNAQVDAYLAANPYVDTESVSEQAWVYFYTNPKEMWTWWKLTGYPRTVRINGPDSDLPTRAYFVQPTAGASKDLTGGGANLLWQRRGVLPKPNEKNAPNFRAAQSELVKSPIYQGLNNTTGRIWWDTQAAVGQQ